MPPQNRDQRQKNTDKAGKQIKHYHVYIKPSQSCSRTIRNNNFHSMIANRITCGMWILVPNRICNHENEMKKTVFQCDLLNYISAIPRICKFSVTRNK